MLCEKRRSPRETYAGEINYSLSVLEFEILKRLELTGLGFDISLSGVGMITDYPVENGHVLKFNSGIEQKVGIVRWSRNSVYNLYATGIQFFQQAPFLEPEVQAEFTTE